MPKLALNRNNASEKEEMEDVLKRGGPASVVWRDDWEMAVLLF